MLRWMANHVVWFLIRCAITLACLWTIQNLMNREGYHVSFSNLLLNTICILVGIRLWMPRPPTKEESPKDTTWVG